MGQPLPESHAVGPPPYAQRLAHATATRVASLSSSLKKTDQVRVELTSLRVPRPAAEGTGGSGSAGSGSSGVQAIIMWVDMKYGNTGQLLADMSGHYAMLDAAGQEADKQCGSRLMALLRGVVDAAGGEEQAKEATQALIAASKAGQPAPAGVLDSLTNGAALKEALGALSMASACCSARAPAPPPSAYVAVTL